MSAPDEFRRSFLLRALAAGLFAMAPQTRAERSGKLPHALPAGQSVYRLKGELRVNGQRATAKTRIRPNDHLATAADSHAIFVVGKDAFLLRENSQLQLSGDQWLVEGMRLVTGAVLSVFGKSRHRFETATATIGIRGTGLYVEAQPELSYICTCYGTVDIHATAGAGATETIQSRHHDAARYVDAAGRIIPGKFINHSDEELMLIEALVGRTPPFLLIDDSDGIPHR